jgi:hypothetical protein
MRSAAHHLPDRRDRRPSLGGLRPQPLAIILNHKIPHIQVLPDGREIKTQQSQRMIPLAVASLMAMKLQSALVNQALKGAQALPERGNPLFFAAHLQGPLAGGAH